MFHYQSHTRLGPRRFSKDIALGDTVRSHFRAQWTGTVVSLIPAGGCADVLVTHSRRGVPLRKPLRKVLHCDWLTVVSRPVTSTGGEP